MIALMYRLSLITILLFLMVDCFVRGGCLLVWHWGCRSSTRCCGIGVVAAGVRSSRCAAFHQRAGGSADAISLPHAFEFHPTALLLSLSVGPAESHAQGAPLGLGFSPGLFLCARLPPLA